jgi:hypothetical protein
LASLEAKDYLMWRARVTVWGGELARTDMSNPLEAEASGG